MEILHHQIELRAYDLWQERGCPWGTPEADWYMTEQELRPESALARAAREVGNAIGHIVALVS
jgi:hypothetical protein